MLKRLGKRIARLLCGPYELNRIYLLELGKRDIQPPVGLELRRITSPEYIVRSPDPQLQEHAWYAGENAAAFGLWKDGSLASMCVFWNHHRFKDDSLVSISDGEAIMVDLVTAAEYRGQGYASAVIRFAESELKRDGFRRLYSWVWHSNEPSKRTFDKAGWTYVAFVAKIKPPLTGKPLRFVRHIRQRG